MIIAIDNSVLTLILNPSAKASPDPSTGLPTPDIELKLLSLLDDLSAQNARLIVPTPAISEALCVATPSSELLEKLDSFSCIDPQGFGMRAAIDLADLIKANKGEIRKIRDDATKAWQHLKMDFLIVGVALASKASAIYTDDKSQSEFAKLAGLDVRHTWDLKITGRHRQAELFEKDSNDRG